MENHEFLKTLNTTVHHEMITPLSANVEICHRLLKKLKNNELMQKLVKVLLVSSQMIMMHANDLLDQRIIESGSFVPKLTSGSIIDVI